MTRPRRECLIEMYRKDYITAQALDLGYKVHEALPMPFQEPSNMHDMKSLFDETPLSALFNARSSFREWTKCAVMINGWPVREFAGSVVGVLQALAYCEGCEQSTKSANDIQQSLRHIEGIAVYHPTHEKQMWDARRSVFIMGLDTDEDLSKMPPSEKAEVIELRTHNWEERNPEPGLSQLHFFDNGKTLAEQLANGE